MRILGSTGPLLVAAHGAEGRWQEWQILADQLHPHYRLLVLDLPWRAGNDYTWACRASAGQWLEQALDQIDEPIYALLGHSLGANAFLDLCGRNSKSAPPAVLFAPFFCPPAAANARHPDTRFVSLFRYAIRDGMRLAMGDRADKLDRPVFDAMVDTVLGRVGEHGIQLLTEHFVATAGLHLATGAPPTLILADPEDPALSGGGTKALSAAMPHAVVKHRTGYGHCFHVEKATAVAAEVTDFLGRVTA